jgi:hypothetical protein
MEVYGRYIIPLVRWKMDMDYEATNRIGEFTL